MFFIIYTTNTQSIEKISEDDRAAYTDGSANKLTNIFEQNKNAVN